jgi:uncharacterized protein (DUF2147 family)
MEAPMISRRSALFAALALLSLAAAPTAFAQQVPQDAIIGQWEADDGSVKLDMYKAGAEFQAHLLYGNQVMEADNATFKLDAKNPDPALRSRSLENVVFIWGLRWDDGEWSGGSLYDGSSGQTYRCKAETKSGKMLLRGYLGISLLGQTREFHRIRS